MKNIINKKYIKFTLLLLMAFFSLCVFCIDLDLISPESLEASSRIGKFIEKCIESFDGYNIAYIPMFIAFYYFYSKNYFKGNKINIVATILSMFFSLVMVFGYSYQHSNSWDLIFGSLFQLMKSIIVALGYYIMFYIIIKLLYEKLDQHRNIETKDKVLNFIFEKHTFIMSFIIILIFWLPYIVFFYPGTTPGGDVRDEIYCIYHLDNYTLKSINLISDDVYINTHHPVIHIAMLGLFMKIGEAVGNYSFGLFLYTLLQVILTIATLSYVLVWMKKRSIPIWIRIVTLLIFSLLSFIPLFAVNLGKEMYSSILTILYILLICDLTLDTSKLKKKSFNIILIIVMLLLMLFRNDGIYRVTIPFMVIILVNRKLWKRLLLLLIIPIVIYQLYSSVLLPALKISKGSIREMLSIPFQQTARTVEVHGKNAYNEEEQKIINRILDYDSMADDYDSNSADPVKNKYKKEANSEDLIEYFKVWIKNFFRYPTDYIQATLNNTYQYFYPDQSKRVGYITLDGLDDGIFNISLKEDTQEERMIIYNIHKSIRDLPVIGMIYSVGFHIDFLLVSIGYLIYKKKYKKITILMPLLVTLLICIASPINGHWRYALPIIMSFPITISIITLNEKSEIPKEE